MEALGLYLLKASAILALFFVSYQAYLKRETHFGLNRAYLLSGILAALGLPLLEFTRTVTVAFTPVATTVTRGTGILPAETAALGWDEGLGLLYLGGALAGLFLMARQLVGILRLIRTHQGERRDGFVYLPSDRVEAPFSFFRYIFYNPGNHSEAELRLILEHERAHGAQWHSLDILLGRLAGIILWVNPLCRWYRQSMAQNLEFLADAETIRRVPSVKEYQYTLLRVSAGNRLSPALANSFYSSFIKKRILMLHQHQSRRAHMLKHLIILPVLALFLLAFNTRTVYVPETAPTDTVTLQEGKTIELIIDKDTSDEELQEIKTKLASDGMDFSYTAVRNAQGEIIGLDIDIQGKTAKGSNISGSYSQSDDTPIEPTLIRLDDAGSLFIGQADTGRKMTYRFTGDDDADQEKQVQVWVHRDGDGEEETIEVREKEGKNVFIVNGAEVDAETLSEDSRAKKIMVKLKSMSEDSDMDVQIHEIRVSEDGDEEHIIEVKPGKAVAKTIEVKEVNGNKTYVVDGKVVSKLEWEELNEGGDKMIVHTAHVRKIEDADGKHIIISDDLDYDNDIIAEGGKTDFIFIDSDKRKDPLVFIDGKKANMKKMKALKQDQIASIEIMKGQKAIDQYGKKAEDGVILITTKK
ncbi:M56 family metallopeptidase [Robiginitalea sediminis]|uniref:M56 family metallopeptidase n=1 Tax=Robiginitalea sediminis TaxID=1982593 RepID=UPI000B4B49C4|nr:M56 family metallopeptidase [Robiginitalea sediminis]